MGHPQHFSGLAQIAAEKDELAGLPPSEALDVGRHVRCLSQVGIYVVDDPAAPGEFTREGGPDAATVLIVEIENRPPLEAQPVGRKTGEGGALLQVARARCGRCSRPHQ